MFRITNFIPDNSTGRFRDSTLVKDASCARDALVSSKERVKLWLRCIFADNGTDGVEYFDRDSTISAPFSSLHGGLTR